MWSRSHHIHDHEYRTFTTVLSEPDGLTATAYHQSLRLAAGTTTLAVVVGAIALTALLQAMGRTGLVDTCSALPQRSTAGGRSGESRALVAASAWPAARVRSATEMSAAMRILIFFTVIPPNWWS